MKMTKDMKDRAELEMSKLKKRIIEIRSNPKELPIEFVRSTIRAPVDLKEKTVGKYSIVKDTIMPGRELTVVSYRNWLMMGYKVLKYVTDVERTIHKLVLKGQGLLMSDSPQEMFLQYDAYKDARGRVLVGGLGLGMYSEMIASKPEVTEVIVVEIEADVIELTKPSNPKIKIINQDIKKYLKTSKEIFDYIYIDIHYSTGGYEYGLTVIPLRKIIEKRFPGTPNHFWAEDEMKTQYEGLI